MNLRDYQSDLIGDIRGAFARGRRAPVAVLPTGGGKTVVAASIARGASDKGRRMWIIAHRRELVMQPSATLTRLGVKPGIIKAGFRPDFEARIQVASIQSLVRRIAKYPPPDLIVIDECHHAVSGQYRQVIEANPQARILGFTATPSRLDGRGLGEVFDEIVLGPDVFTLMERGHLSSARYFAPPGVADFSQVAIRRGDYATGELEEAMNKPAITGDAVAHYRRFCDGQPALVFCVSVAHAEAVAAAYSAAGYRAASVDGSMKPDERADRIEGLAGGKYQVLTSCDLIGEGLDIPHCVAAQLLRPTASLILHLQQIGRVLRPAYGKDHAVILDHVGNVARHRFAETAREWSLEAKRGRNNNEGVVAVATCPQCFSAHPPAPRCPLCGYEYPPKPREIIEEEGTLAEIKVTQEERVARRVEERTAATYEDFLRIGKERGYKNPSGWAWIRMQKRKKVSRKFTIS